MKKTFENSRNKFGSLYAVLVLAVILTLLPIHKAESTVGNAEIIAVSCDPTLPEGSPPTEVRETLPGVGGTTRHSCADVPGGPIGLNDFRIRIRHKAVREKEAEVGVGASDISGATRFFVKLEGSLACVYGGGVAGLTGFPLGGDAPGKDIYDNGLEGGLYQTIGEDEYPYPKHCVPLPPEPIVRERLDWGDYIAPVCTAYCETCDSACAAAPSGFVVSNISQTVDASTHVNTAARFSTLTLADGERLNFLGVSGIINLCDSAWSAITEYTVDSTQCGFVSFPYGSMSGWDKIRITFPDKGVGTFYGCPNRQQNSISLWPAIDGCGDHRWLDQGYHPDPNRTSLFRVEGTIFSTPASSEIIVTNGSPSVFRGSPIEFTNNDIACGDNRGKNFIHLQHTYDCEKNNGENLRYRINGGAWIPIPNAAVNNFYTNSSGASVDIDFQIYETDVATFDSNGDNDPTNNTGSYTVDFERVAPAPLAACVATNCAAFGLNPGDPVCASANVERSIPYPEVLNAPTIANGGHINPSNPTGNPFTAIAVECVKETINNILFTGVDLNDDGTIDDSESAASLYDTIQESMVDVVEAMLVLYVIFIGYQIVMSNKLPDYKESTWIVIKVAAVLFFAVNSGMSDMRQDLYQTMDWMSGVVMDGVLGIDPNETGANRFSDIQSGAEDLDDDIARANFVGDAPLPSEDPADTTTLTLEQEAVLDAREEALQYGYNYCDYRAYEYPSGKEYLRMFDSLDCRMGKYLGLNTPGAENLPMTIMIGVAAIFTNILGVPIFILSMALVVFLFTIIFRIIQIYIVASVALAFLILIAPLAIPMVLFKYTRFIFEKWYKQLLSYMIQPVIMFAFLALIFGIYDNAFYEDNYLFNQDNMLVVDGTPYVDVHQGVPVTRNGEGRCDDEDALGCIYQKMTFSRTDDGGFGAAFSFAHANMDMKEARNVLSALIQLFILTYLISMAALKVEDLSTKLTNAAGGGAAAMATAPQVDAPDKTINKVRKAGHSLSKNVSKVVRR